MSVWNLHEHYKGLSPLPPVSRPDVFGGYLHPCYQLEAETADSWNMLAVEENTRSFRHYFGRDPETYAEVEKWAGSVTTDLTFGDCKNHHLQM